MSAGPETHSSDTTRASADEKALSKEEQQNTPEATTVSPDPPLSKARKSLILFLLCAAQFFDVYNATAAIVILPSLGETDIGFTPNALQWVVSAYTLTFASFMLASGALSDIYHPKPIFVIGFAIVGLAGIPTAAGVDPIMIIVFRAIQGIGAAMNIPSAVAMISFYFPEPAEQGVAFAAFGGTGAVGNALGFVIGGVIAARTSWRWVFYIISIAVIPLTILSYFVMPRFTVPVAKRADRKVDWLGVSVLTAGLILFVYAISDGSDAGWGTARIIAPLVISIFLVAAFFLIERWVSDPAVPPSVWTNKNFGFIFIYGWTVNWFLFSAELNLVQAFEAFWHDGALTAAIRCLPIGIAGFVSAMLVGNFGPKLPRRLLLLGGQVLMGIGCVLFAFADRRSRYWSYVFPGMIIGMFGTAVAYVGSTIIVMADSRPGEQGIIGGLIITAFQLGSTLGTAISTSITLSVNAKYGAGGYGSSYEGYAATYWSVLAVHGIAIIAVLIFIRN